MIDGMEIEREVAEREQERERERVTERERDLGRVTGQKEKVHIPPLPLLQSKR